MKRDDIAIILVVGISMVVFAGCAAMGPSAFLCVLFGQTTAAWVQAVGSIAAIWGAVWISRQETRRSNQLERDRLLRWADSIGAVFDRAGDFVSTVCVATRTAEQALGFTEFIYVPNDVQEILDEMQAIRIEDLGSRRSVLAFYELRKALRLAKLHADSLMAATELELIDWQEYRGQLDRLLINCRQAQQELAATTALRVFSV